MKCGRQSWKYLDGAGGTKNGVENFGAGNSWKISACKMRKCRRDDINTILDRWVVSLGGGMKTVQVRVH